MKSRNIRDEVVNVNILRRGEMMMGTLNGRTSALPESVLCGIR